MSKGKKAPNLYAYLAALYQEKKRYPEAEDILKEGLKDFPQSAELHYGLGEVYSKMEHFEESIKQMRHVLGIDPEHAEALNFIGYSYADQGIHLAEAERLIHKALTLKPDNGYILDSMGWVYFKQNKMEQAIHYLKEAGKRIPEDPTIAEHLGDAFKKAGRIQEAMEAYKQALKLSPENRQLRQKIEQMSN